LKFFRNLIEMNFRDFGIISESDLSETGMVGLVIEWVIEFHNFRWISRCGPYGRIFIENVVFLIELIPINFSDCIELFMVRFEPIKVG